MDGWGDPQTAELYDRFTRNHSLYRETSDDLVDLARLEHAELVVDLACGTGVTTEAILGRVGPTTMVIALDSSDAMLAVAQHRVIDSRVQWLLAPAVELPERASNVDAIICNSAIWQLDMELAITAVCRSFRPGGRLVFNIARQFLTLPLSQEELRPAKPTFYHLIQAIAVLEFNYVPPHPAIARRRQMTPENVEEMLRRGGLEPIERRTFEYESRPEAQLAWLQIPVFAENVLPGMPYESQHYVIAKAYDRLDKSSTLTSPWTAFVAKRPSAPHGS